MSERCQKAIPELPITAFHRPMNMKNMLVRVTISPRNSNPGFKPCNISQCKTCPFTTVASSFRSFTNEKTFKIRHALSCHSHIIYPKCSKQIIGKTVTTLRKRFTSHRFDMFNDRGSSVDYHFNLPDHTLDKENIIAIDHLPASGNTVLHNIETHWIHTLQTTDQKASTSMKKIIVPDIFTSQGFSRFNKINVRP